ncbi:unnamed protein product, partial [Aureobasidium vineae]
MTLARDTSFPDAQIRAICDTVTQDNVNDFIELLRRLHASQETSLVLATAASPVQSISSFESRAQARLVKRTSSEPGAVLCADTFYRLCKDDQNKPQRLSLFCPFTLVFRKCSHGGGCQLEHICWCKRPASCKFSHKFAPTCDSVLDGTRCSKTRRLVNNNKKRACARNHDYKVRLFMGAVRVSHELGFYGVDNNHIDRSVTPVNELGNAVQSSWMASDVERTLSGSKTPCLQLELRKAKLMTAPAPWLQEILWKVIRSLTPISCGSLDAVSLPQGGADEAFLFASRCPFHFAPSTIHGGFSLSADPMIPRPELRPKRACRVATSWILPCF